MLVLGVQIHYILVRWRGVEYGETCLERELRRASVDMMEERRAWNKDQDQE